MTIPIEASSFTYTPESLKGIAGAPTFTLRYGTRRDRHKFQQELARRGLVSHTDDDIRIAVLAEMRRLSQNSQEAIDKMVDAAERYWQAIDALGNEITAWLKECAEIKGENPDANLPPAPKLEFDAAEEAWISNIINTVSAESDLIGNMRADNAKRNFEMKEIALAATLLEVDGFELSRRHDGLIEAASLIALEEWIGDKAEGLGLAEIDSGNPYEELRIAAEATFWLPKVAEKNFAAPPPSISSETSSTLHGEQSDDIQSKASAKSKETPESTSPTQTSDSSTLPSHQETDGEMSTGPTVAD